jgi:hypothetical protein
MTHDARANPWRSQSAVTQIGRSPMTMDDLPSDLGELRAVSQQLVAHYMGSSDGTTGPIAGERLKEVDTRYADAMVARLADMGPPTLARERSAGERIVGCCRDFAVLFVAMARHKGFPARVRIGYATYFQPGWYLDHAIAEVWDSGAERWRLLEPEISATFVPTGGAFDPLDVPPDRFVTGPRAWLAARSGQLDPERFVAAPDVPVPYTRSWLSLRHHVVQDLAALNKAEMLVWDQWGILDEDDPLRHAAMLDQLARATADPACSVAVLATGAQAEGLRVPQTVTSYSPAHPDPLKVDVRRVLEGMIRS